MTGSLNFPLTYEKGAAVAYEGEELLFCPAQPFAWDDAYAVVVSGAWFNPYDHMLLNTGG